MEIEVIQDELDDTCERERHHKQLCEKLNIEIKHLSTNLEESLAKEAESERQMKILAQHCEKLMKEREDANLDVIEAKRRLEELIEEKNNQDDLHLKLQNDMTQCKERIEQIKNCWRSEKIKNDELQRQIEDKAEDGEEKRTQYDFLNQRHAEIQNELNEAKKNLSEKNKQYSSLKSLNEEMTAKSNDLAKHCKEQDCMIDDLNLTINKLKSENQEKTFNLKNLERNLESLQRNKDLLNVKAENLKEEKRDMDQIKQDLECSIVSLTKELEIMAKNLESEKKNYLDAVREKNILAKNLMKASSESQKQNQLLSLHENGKKSLENEMQKLRDETHQQHKLIQSLEREKERYICEASDLTTKIGHYMRLNDDKDIHMAQFKTQLDNFEAKLQYQRSLYESARSECNASNKSLIEMDQETSRWRSIVRNLEQRCEVLREEIANTECTLAKEKMERQKAERTRETLRSELNGMTRRLEDFQAQIEVEKDKKASCENKLIELERKITDLGRENLKLTAAKDLFSGQLIRKTQEVQLLCQKVDIQSTILARGESKYKQKLNDVQNLRKDTKRLNSELVRISKLSGCIEEERKKLYHLQDELQVERKARKAAEIAAETPLNVHRWRKLEAQDPNKFQLIKRTQALQKLVISKDRDLEISKEKCFEAQKQLDGLKRRNKKLIGPEIVLQCRQLEQQVRLKADSIKVLKSENKAFQDEINRLKSKIDSLNENILILYEEKNFKFNKNNKIPMTNEIKENKTRKKEDNLIINGDKMSILSKRFITNSIKAIEDEIS